MILSKQTLTAKLYIWFYKADKLPTNLCTYFWNALIAYLLFVPSYTLSLLNYLLYFCKEFKDDQKYIPLWARGLLGCGVLALLSLIYIILSPLALFFIEINAFIKGAIFLDSIIIGVAIVFLIIYSFSRKSNRISITKEYIKSVKGRYCPKITWED